MAEIKWRWYTNHWTIHWNPHSPTSWDSWVMTPMPKLKPERSPRSTKKPNCFLEKSSLERHRSNQTWIFSFKMLVFGGVVNHWITQKYYRLYRLRSWKIGPNCPKGSKFSSSNHPFAVASCWFQGELVLWVSLSWAFWKLNFLFSKKNAFVTEVFFIHLLIQRGEASQSIGFRNIIYSELGGKTSFFEDYPKNFKPRNASCRPTDTSSGSLTPNFWWRAKHKPKSSSRSSWPFLRRRSPGQPTAIIKEKYLKALWIYSPEI